MAKTRSESSPAGGGGRVPFRVDLQRSNRSVWVLARGDLDKVALEHLDEALTLALSTDRQPCVEVDLRAVTFIDGAAVDVLLGAARQARAAGGALWVANPPLQLRSLLAGPRTGHILGGPSRPANIDSDL